MSDQFQNKHTMSELASLDSTSVLTPASSESPAPPEEKRNIDAIIAENDQLKAQIKKSNTQVGLPAEMTTTTTKQVWLFTVSGEKGDDSFNVVDESEAKRLYCVKHKIDPSLFVLKVRCDDKGREASIVKQYADAGANIDRIPGVNLGV